MRQVLDNHVVRYIPPEDYVKTTLGDKRFRNKTPLGCLVVGAEACNPEVVNLILNVVFLILFSNSAFFY